MPWKAEAVRVLTKQIQPIEGCVSVRADVLTHNHRV